LIEGNVKMIQTGADLAKSMSSEFSEVASSVIKAGGLVREISAASQEQAQGVQQINQSVGAVDKVVQENAANAEEAAATSTQMQEQAEQMLGFVNRLVVLIEGSQDKAGAGGGPGVNKLQKSAAREPKDGPGTGTHSEKRTKLTPQVDLAGISGGSKVAESPLSSGNGESVF